jgi:hypothetical protein
MRCVVQEIFPQNRDPGVPSVFDHRDQVGFVGPERYRRHPTWRIYIGPGFFGHRID